MTTFLFLVILSEVLLPNLSYTSRVRRQDTRVRISSTGDTIMLKFLQSDHDTKLAGYIVGYGRTMFSKQFIQLPENGEPYETVIDAEPKYLIAVQPINEDVVKKECSGKDILDKPLHLVIGSVTPNSVLLSWGTIVRTSSDTEANQVDCVEDSQYTVRYRQKESSKNWSYQTCPTTDTVIDKLSPSTTYEFGVRAETDTVNGRWSPPVTHNTADITAPVSPGNLISSLATTSGIPIPTEVTFHKSYFVPIKNVTSSGMTSTFRHTTSIPLQNTTLGTESDGIASSPSSEDSLFLKHTYTYSRMSTPPSRSAHYFQPKSVTATQQQLTSKKTPLSTSQISKSKILPSTDNAMHSHRTIDILSTAHHQPETSTSQVQFTMIKYIPKATQKNPLTPQHLSITLQPITIQSQTYSTKSQPSATQSLTDTTHSHPHTSQSPPILTKSSTTKSGSSTSKTHPKITKPTSRKPQEPSMTQSKRIVQKSSTFQPQNTDKIYQPVPSLPTNSILDNSVTNKLLTYSSTKSDRKQNYESPHKNPQHTQYLLSTEADTSSPTTSQYLSFTAEYTPSPTETKDLYSTSSIETKSYPSNLPPVVTKSTNSHFITSLYYKSVQTQIPIESKPKTTNAPYNTTIHVLHVPNKPYKKWEPPSKSNYSQNSSQTEKTMVSKKPPGHKQGRFSTTHSVVHQSAPTVTQSPKQMQDTQPPTSPVSLKSDRNQDQINSSTAVHPLVHPVTNAPSQRQDGQLLPKPYRVKTNRSQDQEKSLSSIVSPSASGKRQANTSSLPLVQPLAEAEIQPHDEKHKGIAQAKPVNEPQTNQELQGNPRVPFKTKPNQVEKEKEVKIADVPDLKQLDKLPLLKPQGTPFAEKSVYPTTVPTPTLFTPNGSRFDMGDNSSGFSAVPGSDVDAMGKKRFVAPHVIYKTDKPPDEPCSVTQSLSYFPEEDGVSVNITGPPRTPPTNLTVVTVEGCPSFIILDWEKTDNETTEYDVTSAIKSPNGDEVSVVTTNQTHTAVENLKPESSYEFTVIPKNELGSGPPSEPVSFNTESADPRVSEIPTGKNAIWSSFPFKADSYSECTGTMYVKRTWYRKFVGIQLCNSLRYKIYLSDSLKGKFYNIGDVSGNGEDHCQFVDSYLDGRTGGAMSTNRLPPRKGFFRSMRQEPVRFGKIGGNSHINYVAWYECGVPIPGSW